MSDSDLQFRMSAKIGNLLSTMDRVEAANKRIEAELKRVNKAAGDVQKSVQKAFVSAALSAADFNAQVKNSGHTMTDFQNSAGNSLLVLKTRFKAFSGVAIAGGGAATLALTGIVKAARAASEAIDEAMRKAAEAARGPGTKKTEAALAAASIPGVDAEKVMSFATTTHGTASQDSINEFVTRLAETNRDEDKEDLKHADEMADDDKEDAINRAEARRTGKEFKPKKRKERDRKFHLNQGNVDLAVMNFAQFGGIPGASDLLIDDLKKTGTTSHASHALSEQLNAARRADPGGVGALEQNRSRELETLRLGASNNARHEAAVEEEIKVANLREGVRQAGRSPISRGLHALFGVGGVTEDIGDVFTPGSGERRRAEKAVNARKEAVKVEVVRQPLPSNWGE